MVSNQLIDKSEKLAVIGLGYVGLPIAISFAKKIDVIGFDISKEKIAMYKLGIDPTNEVGNDEIKASSIEFTSDEDKLKEALFYVVAVPTPINLDKTPNLDPVVKASELIGRNIKKNSIVVYESTVYPGVTEDVCIPILERESGMKCGIDFKVGYSPERINPGDKVHTLENIVKIVSGVDEESLSEISKVYELVIKAGVHKAPTIKVAEAAKVVENSQRDINIAFMNELAIVFDKMNIDSKDVLEAMNTKWNSLGFSPGLVGGHCIGVDPYYFIYEAEKLGYHSQIILSGRKINDSMGNFIAENIVKELILANKKVKEAKIAILGITFKENTPDTRNSKVVDIVTKLKEYNINPIIVDPVADAKEAKHEYGIELKEMNDLSDLDCLILAVPHDYFSKLSLSQIDSFYKNEEKQTKILFDIKSILNKKALLERGYVYWNL